MELKQLITSNFYSVLYYNCEICLSTILNTRVMKQLVSTSTMALKLTENCQDLLISYERMHDLHKRGKPQDMMKYRLPIQLYKLYNANNHMENVNWMDLNLQQNFNDRNNFVQIFETSKIMIGRNTLVNRFKCLNNTIEYDWLNLSLDTFKVRCKLKFLP